MAKPPGSRNIGGGSENASRRRALGPLTTGLFLSLLGLFWWVALLTVDVQLDPASAAEASPTGLAGVWLAFGALMTVGPVASHTLATLTSLWGVRVARRGKISDSWLAVAGGLLMTAAVAFLSAAAANRFDLAQGGLLLEYLGPWALACLGRVGLFGLSGLLLGLGLILALGDFAGWLGERLADGLCALGRWLAAALRWSGRGAGRSAATAARALADGVREGWRLPVVAANPVSAAAAESRFPASTALARTASVGASAGEAARSRRPRRQVMVEIEEVEERPAVEDRVRPRPASESPRRETLADEDGGDRGAGPAAAAAPAGDEGDADILPSARRAPPPPRPARSRAAPDPESESDPGGESGPESPPAPVSAKTSEKTSPSDYYMIDEIDPAAPPAPPAAKPPQAARPAPKAERIDRVEARPADIDPAKYELPALPLLDAPPPPVAHNRLALEKRARILEQTLTEFKIDGRVVHIERGPRVTLYEISLAPGIKLNRVTTLADNIAMMLRASSVRIIAPIPGKDTIGIEIPNLEKETVSLREIVETINRNKRAQALPICLGKDVGGQPLVADLARMPHLLIAGATGSGKSVCINSVILSILACCRPDEIKLIMVDPKVVELSRFRDIPHLMSPVITDMKRAVAVLDWVCQKMDERYEQMALVGVNNIAKFNALGSDSIARRLSGVYDEDELELFPKFMPYIVLIIDELADLMMVAGKEVEHHITRLAAKSRAVGIHLLLATQRPSVDVITGLIKANMPCRIAFQVASKVDSRTILDQNGAETLLGAGDMLYLPPGVGKLTRAQGVFVSDEELFRVVDFCKAQARPQYHAELEGPVIGGGGEVDMSDLDEMFLKSGEAIIESGRGSVSLLQRKLGIGYGRASRIIDQLTASGVLGPFRDGKAREILMTLDEFTAKFAGDAAKAAARRLTLDDDDNAFAGLRPDERAPNPGAPWDDD